MGRRQLRSMRQLEERQGAAESYYTVFPVKLARSDLLLIQITVRDRVTSWKNIRGSRVLK